MMGSQVPDVSLHMSEGICALNSGKWLSERMLTYFSNMAWILANYYASVYRIDEGRDHPSLPEPSTIVSAPHFIAPAVHKELSTLATAKGPDDLQTSCYRV